jgi:hypothetical protein
MMAFVGARQLWFERLGDIGYIAEPFGPQMPVPRTPALVQPGIGATDSFVLIMTVRSIICASFGGGPVRSAG